MQRLCASTASAGRRRVLSIDGKTVRGSRHTDPDGIEAPGRHLLAVIDQHTLAAYAGLAPVTWRSGTSIKGETRSQRGNHVLKSALFLSAFASLSDPASRAYYDRKRAAGKRHNAALICLARRRTDVIYAMLRDRKPYRATRPVPAPLAA